MWADMTETPTSRFPPRIIRVPPPDKRLALWLLVVIAAFFCGLAYLGALTAPSPANFIFPALALFLGALLPYALWSRVARFRGDRARLLAAHPDAEADPLACAIAAHWEDRPPQDDEVQRLLGTIDTPPATAWVVCFGLIELPEVAEMRFEPHIITATELLGRRLVLVPISLAIITLWLLQVAHVLPGKFFDLGGFMYFIVAGIFAGAAWVWRSGIHPTYFRLAPGIVQVLEYRLRRAKPIIRSYPMEPGTLVVVAREGKDIKATFLRSGQKDVLPFRQMRHRAEVIEQFWRAVLSTAPIPQLNDEELVG
jgi:hypothetical protein